MLNYAVTSGLLLLLAVPLLAHLRLALRPHPGPFWARWSKLWYFSRVWRGRFEHDNIDLHRRYGPVVRVAPNWYSIDDPAAAKKIYGLGTKLSKAAWYEAFAPPDHRGHLFADRNEKRHTADRRKYQAMYSMTSMVHYEPLVDECAGILTDRLTEFAESGKPFNLGHWLQCYAFDVIGNITFSKRFGFLDDGRDVRRIIAGLNITLLYGSLIGIYSALHPILFRVLRLLSSRQAGGVAYVGQFAEEAIAERKRDLLDPTHNENDSHQAGRPSTFLEKVLEAQASDPEKMTPYDVTMVCRSNVAAGSDTTGITLAATLYYLHNTPRALQKLRQEVQECEARRQQSTRCFTFKESQEMPYLQAVIKETLRIHPAAGLPFWRDVPEHGVEISGYAIPPDSVVGINPWCAHRNVKVFGQDANVYRPERWIDANKDQIVAMDAYWMPVSTLPMRPEIKF